MVDALGIAGSQAAGSMEFLASGAWSKRMHPGWEGYSGMIAALLGKEGFRGPSTIIEGKGGFLHAYSGMGDAQKILEGLGSSFEMIRTGVKPHACCRYKQPGIDGVLKIMVDNSLKPSEIDHARVAVLKIAAGWDVGAKRNNASISTTTLSQKRNPYFSRVSGLR